MSEIEKALAELKALMKYRAEQLGYVEEFRGLGLTSRKNLCLHPSVKREKSGSVVDARCRSLTAGFVKEKKERGEDVDVCIYHDVSSPTSPASSLLRALWTRFVCLVTLELTRSPARILIYSSRITSSRRVSGRWTAYCGMGRNTNNARISQLDAW
jgi:hypothetical protein